MFCFLSKSVSLFSVMIRQIQMKTNKKKLHFHSNYLQLHGAFLLVSEMPCLAKVMQALGCHWHAPEVTTYHWQMGRGCRRPGTLHGAASASGRASATAAELQRPASSQGSRHRQSTGAWAWLSGQEDLVAGAHLWHIARYKRLQAPVSSSLRGDEL